MKSCQPFTGARRIGAATIALAMAALAAAGCDENEAVTDDIAAVSLDDFPGRYAQAFCAQNFKCSPASDIGDHTLQQCTDDSTTGLELLGLVVSDGQAANRVAYDGAKMATCIDAVAQMSCAQWQRGLTLWTNQPAPCRAAIQPQVAAGGPCQQDVECITTHCEGADNSAEVPLDGVCQALLGPGASCASGGLCEDALYCEGATATCVARKPGGSACLSDEECMNSCNVVSGTCSGYVGCAVGGEGTPVSWGMVLVLAVVSAVVVWFRRRGGGVQAHDSDYDSVYD